MYTTLISTAELVTLPKKHRVILDCRFQLNNPDAGHQEYQNSHLPGAHYLHLDHDLSSPPSGHNGRHPLPERTILAKRLGQCGITQDTQVICYDDGPGPFAARAWWLLRWMGHRHVAVLNGGWAAWRQARQPICNKPTALATSIFIPGPDTLPVEDAATLLEHLHSSHYVIIDARSEERFRGRGKGNDPIGGHIPGAHNRFYMLNLNPSSQFKLAEQLRAEWQELLGNIQPNQVVHQCGSGVTACHNMLAMEHAGLFGSRLYPGSWSEWSTLPGYPIDTTQ